jgi:hypothetical protein
VDTLVENKFFLTYSQQVELVFYEQLLLFCSIDEVKPNVLSGIEEQLRWHNRRVSVPNYEQYLHSFWV